MSIVGFTGTRMGMTAAQMSTFARLRTELQLTVFHHGDCVGADAEAHDLVVGGGSPVEVHVHPPVDDTHRAWKKGDVEHKPLTHFARNRAIVIASDVLMAASASPERLTRGGAWYTIDYARKLGKPVVILWPDGATG